jgi:single-stranded DNA-binding protein
VHVNTCTLVGRVSPAGPKLSYASSGTPICSLVVEVDEMGLGEKIFTTWLPVRITGKYAEQTSVDLEPGDIVQISGKLKYESAVDQKSQQKSSELVISTWGISQRQPAMTSPDAEGNSTFQEVACNTEASEPVPGHKPRKRAIPKHLGREWQPEHEN